MFDNKLTLLHRCFCSWMRGKAFQHLPEPVASHPIPNPTAQPPRGYPLANAFLPITVSERFF